MIINASPLIIFGKLNRISLLKKIYLTLEIAESVYEEAVTKGMEKNVRDAFIINENISNKNIIVVELNGKFEQQAKKISEIYGIDIGESETIALALQLGKKEVVIDEKAAREAAKAVGVKPIGSLRVLLMAFARNLLTKAEIKEIVTEMENTKYRFSPQVLIEFWNIFDKVKNK